MFCLRKYKGKYEDIIVLIVALIIFSIGFSIHLIDKYEIGKHLVSFLSIGRWRLYIFFVFGTLVKKHYDKFIHLTENQYVMGALIIAFVGMIMFNDIISFPFWKPISTLLYGMLGIIVVLSFFRKYQSSFTADKKIGYCLQYIGKRTLDVYLLNNFLYPRDLPFLGVFFSKSLQSMHGICIYDRYSISFNLCNFIA